MPAPSWVPPARAAACLRLRVGRAALALARLALEWFRSTRQSGAMPRRPTSIPAPLATAMKMAVY
jgi:hypothetical protein